VVAAAVDVHRDFVAAETLATALTLDEAATGFGGEVGDGETVTVSVTRTV
jgi:isoleucyl-tRNA synthetase